MSPNNNAASVLRLIARVSSVASLLLLSAFVVGDVRGDGGAPTASEWIGLALFPGGIIIGLALAWWRELLGGAITLLSLVGFYAWHVLTSGGLPAGPYFLLFAAPGLLFLVAALLKRRNEEGNGSASPLPNSVQPHA